MSASTRACASSPIRGYELFDGSGDEPPDPEVDPEAAKAWHEVPIPIYPASAAIDTWNIRKAVALALENIAGIEDPMPLEICRTAKLMGYEPALRRIHQPQHDGDWMQAKRTLRYHEAFLLQTALLQRRAIRAMFAATPRTPQPGGLLARFDAALPFELTDDQRLVGTEIAEDLAGQVPMHRLLQGEVASGKTLVALRAMLAVAESGGQSALLAPTEVLAAQHLRSIAATLGPDLAAELMPTLVTGQLPAAERRRAALRLVTGQARIVVGTHALLSESTEFYDLGLVVVDEQHRFGVEQREVLRRKGSAPHTLVMTATPIPRTVAMTVFGDLETSTIRHLPKGRAPIETHVVPLAEKPHWMPNVWRRAGDEIGRGRQGFVLCPAIGGDETTAPSPEDADDDLLEPDDARPMATVAATLQELRAHPALAGRRIEALTGRMSGEEKDRVMRAFAAGGIDVLVATTVIEVGVDVANASFMIVLDADRFGVSQLHQLRGRVGRGGLPGLCLLVTGAPEGTLGHERVTTVAATMDGFALAQADLELRREGDVLGASQSGGAIAAEAAAGRPRRRHHRGRPRCGGRAARGGSVPRGVSGAPGRDRAQQRRGRPRVPRQELTVSAYSLSGSCPASPWSPVPSTRSRWGTSTSCGARRRSSTGCTCSSCTTPARRRCCRSRSAWRCSSSRSPMRASRATWSSTRGASACSSTTASRSGRRCS